MTKEQRVQHFMAGFYAGGVILALLGSTPISHLRGQLATAQNETQQCITTVRSSRAQIAAVEERIDDLARQWQEDLERARSGPEVDASKYAAAE